MLYVYTKDLLAAMETSLKLSTSGRNVRSVLDSMVSGRPSAEPPKIASTVTPATVQLRGNSFHCDGLFPWTNRLCFFFCPSIYSPTKWVRRHLSGLEMLRVMDIPDSLQAELTSNQRAQICHDNTLLPLKIVLRVLDSLPLPMVTMDASKRRCNPVTELNRNEVALCFAGGKFLSDISSAVSPPRSPESDVTCLVASTPDTASVNLPNLQLACVESSVDPASDDDTVVASNLTLTDLSMPISDIAAVEAQRNLKATKSDNAPVPEYLWDHEIVSPDDALYSVKVIALGRLRNLFLRRWKWNLLREFLGWFRRHHGHNQTVSSIRDWNAGRECISRAWNSTWWLWSDGSRPFFWRWPVEYQGAIRDGLPLWLRGATMALETTS